jgi:hypothetical protein
MPLDLKHSWLDGITRCPVVDAEVVAPFKAAVRNVSAD